MLPAPAEGAEPEDPEECTTQFTQKCNVEQIKSETLAKLIGSMKRKEISQFQVSAATVKEDEHLSSMLATGNSWNQDKDVLFIIELINLYKVEDWYNDRTTTMKTLRKGKGRNPYTDSEIKCKSHRPYNQVCSQT